jgi:hypothetical protein
MSKDLDLDFKDVVAPKVVTKVENQPVTQPPKLDNAKPLGINIALQEGSKVLLKDLAELSGDEFLTWVRRVFPVLDMNTIQLKDFETRQDKSRAFDQILRFHSNSIFNVKKVESKPS